MQLVEGGGSGVTSLESEKGLGWNWIASILYLYLDHTISMEVANKWAPSLFYFFYASLYILTSF